jgi:hypothetical protein
MNEIGSGEGDAESIIENSDDKEAVELAKEKLTKIEK